MEKPSWFSTFSKIVSLFALAHFLFGFSYFKFKRKSEPKIVKAKILVFFLVFLQNSNFSVLQSRTNIGKQNIFCSSSTIVEQYVRRASYFKRNFHLMFQAYGDVGCGVSSLGIQHSINFWQVRTSQKENFISFDFLWAICNDKT